MSRVVWREIRGYKYQSWAVATAEKYDGSLARIPSPCREKMASPLWHVQLTPREMFIIITTNGA
jgi:hypothetical protein